MDLFPYGVFTIALHTLKRRIFLRILGREKKPAHRNLGHQCMDLADGLHGNRFLIDLPLCMAGILNFDRVFLVESKRRFGHVKS